MRFRSLILATLMAPAVLGSLNGSPSRMPDHKNSARFVQNLGQWPEQVKFRTSLGCTTAFFEIDGITWVRSDPRLGERIHHAVPTMEMPGAESSGTGHAWKVHFIGTSGPSRIVSEEEGGYSLNYFHGNNPSHWVTNVHAYSRITYTDLWPGVDMHWHGAGPQMKYDLLLRPGADPDRIALRYEGLDGVSIDDDGSLVLKTSLGDLREPKPVAWYADDHQPLRCEFMVVGGTVRFRFPEAIDRSRPIVIDPLLYGATYSGTNENFTYGYCSTYDATGHIYGSGTSFLSGFPTTLGAFQEEHSSGSWDIVVNKFNPDGSALLWSTYLGGAANQYPVSIATNAVGEVHLLGVCVGSGYPTTTDCFQADAAGVRDIVVTHLNSTGSMLLGSTYLGGTDVDGLDLDQQPHFSAQYKGNIELDPLGNIWLISCTQSADFPVSQDALQTELGGEQDVVVCCLDGGCTSLLRSTYFGGSLIDQGRDLLHTPNGDLYICGATTSPDLLLTTGSYQDSCLCAVDSTRNDGFIARIPSDLATLSNSTYYGTDLDDWAYFMDLDAEGRVFVAGVTQGEMTMDPPGIYGQQGGGVFIASFDPTLTTRYLNTTLGNGEAFYDWFIPSAFGLDSCDQVNISGFEAQAGFECTPGSLDENNGNDRMFYMASFEPNMSNIIYGSYYGGSHVDGGHSRFDKGGILYEAICSEDDEMPATSGAYAEESLVQYDLGLLKIDLDDGLCDMTTGLPRPVVAPLTINPVPASDIITIQVELLGTRSWTILVFDAVGQLTLTGTLGPSRTLDVSGLAAGTYSLKIQDHSLNVGNGRFIKY